MTLAVGGMLNAKHTQLTSTENVSVQENFFLLNFFGCTFLKLESLRLCVSKCRVNVLLNSSLASGDFCSLLIIFANSLDPD